MKFDRTDLNNIKTYLTEAYNKIEKTFESLEEPEEYDAFYNMCNNIVQYCNIWSIRIKPIGINKLSKEKNRIFDAFSEFAMYIVEKMNVLIDSHSSMEASAIEYAQKYKEIEERMRIEKTVLEMLNDEKESEEKKKSKPIGFTQGVSKKKKKTNKKTNKDDKEKLDNTNN